MHKSIIDLLTVLIFWSVYIMSSAAFAQSTPPLDLSIKEQIDTSVPERIPEEVDRRSETTNFPDREVKKKNNSATPPSLTKPIFEENPDNSIGPNSKYRYPPLLIK